MNFSCGTIKKFKLLCFLRSLKRYFICKRHTDKYKITDINTNLGIKIVSYKQLTFEEVEKAFDLERSKLSTNGDRFFKKFDIYGEILEMIESHNLAGARRMQLANSNGDFIKDIVRNLLNELTNNADKEKSQSNGDLGEAKEKHICCECELVDEDGDAVSEVDFN